MEDKKRGIKEVASKSIDFMSTPGNTLARAASRGLRKAIDKVTSGMDGGVKSSDERLKMVKDGMRKRKYNMGTAKIGQEIMDDKATKNYKKSEEHFNKGKIDDYMDSNLKANINLKKGDEYRDMGKRWRELPGRIARATSVKK